MKILAFIIISLIIFNVVRILYFNWKFKKDSKYPCFVVIYQDGVMSKPSYYEEAETYADKWHGTN